MEERGIHRGLVKTEPDRNIGEKHITKAQHNLDAALYFNQGGYSDWSASAFFYCMYHCFLAVLSKFGYESRNQECTIAAMEMLHEEGKIEFDKVFLDALKSASSEDLHEASVIDLREKFQYGIGIEFGEKKQFDKLVNLCKKAIDTTTEIVHKK